MINCGLFFADFQNEKAKFSAKIRIIFKYSLSFPGKIEKMLFEPFL